MAQQRKPTVVITGAAGNIGGALRKKLSRSYVVLGLDLPAACEGRKGMIGCDITDADSVARAVDELRETADGARIASVIHLAAYFDFSGEERPQYKAVNEEGTRNLLRALQDIDVEQFVYSGTMLVHAPGVPGERITEDTPLAPAWAYPQSKARTEEIIDAEAGDIPPVFLHLPSAGPALRPSSSTLRSSSGAEQRRPRGATHLALQPGERARLVDGHRFSRWLWPGPRRPAPLARPSAAPRI